MRKIIFSPHKCNEELQILLHSYLLEPWYPLASLTKTVMQLIGTNKLIYLSLENTLFFFHFSQLTSIY